MEFNIGDRVHKNSGVCSGKDGTVKNILNDGTLAVNFDGEKINRYCDPAACTACNAKFKVGDKVTDGKGVYKITKVDEWADEPGYGTYEWKFVSGKKTTSHSQGGDIQWADPWFKKVTNAINPAINAESVACNLDANAQAEKIAKAYMKWDRTRTPADEQTLHNLIRSVTSLGVKVWVMRDGTIAIQKNKPSGGEDIHAYLNAEAQVAKNGKSTKDGIINTFRLISSEARKYIVKANELEKLCKALRDKFTSAREEAADSWENDKDVLGEFKKTRDVLHDLYVAADNASRPMFSI